MVSMLGLHFCSDSDSEQYLWLGLHFCSDLRQECEEQHQLAVLSGLEMKFCLPEAVGFVWHSPTMASRPRQLAMASRLGHWGLHFCCLADSLAMRLNCCLPEAVGLV